MFSFHSCRIRLANSMSARSLSRSLLRRRRGGRRGRGSGERRLCRRRLHRPLPRRHRLLLPLLRGRVKHLAAVRPPSVRSNDPARRPFQAFRRPLSSLFINYWARSKTNSLARSPLLSKILCFLATLRLRTQVARFIRGRFRRSAADPRSAALRGRRELRPDTHSPAESIDTARALRCSLHPR